jgi:glutamine synthetase
MRRRLRHVGADAPFHGGPDEYASEYTCFLAPYVNSYKRFMKGTFAPTRTVWSVDNRTAGFRLCGEGTKGVRVECRIGGSDMNPYLAQAALLAAGIKGSRTSWSWRRRPPATSMKTRMPSTCPSTLRAATETLRGSKMLREAMGDFVVDHYVRCAEWEQEEFDKRRHRLGNRARFRAGLTCPKQTMMAGVCPGMHFGPEGDNNEQFETDLPVDGRSMPNVRHGAG